MKKREERKIDKMTESQAEAALKTQLQRDARIAIGRFHDRVEAIKKFRHKLSPESVNRKYDEVRDSYDNFISNFREQGYSEIIDEAIADVGGFPEL